MRNSARGRLRWWRTRRCSSQESYRHSAEQPGLTRGQTTPGETVGGKTGGCEIGPPDTRAGGTNVRKTSPSRAAAGESVAAAMQAAIALITASMDSPELEAWALPVLIPHDADGLGDLMAGLHVISELVIHELHDATGEPPQAILQRLAILAEHRRGMPSAS
jgi:hypothetical protein